MKFLQHPTARPRVQASERAPATKRLRALRSASSFVAGLTLLATMTVAHAATIVVNGSDDTIHAGNCTLRAAIASMNGAALQGACANTGAAFGTGDTINFAPSVTAIVLNDTVANSLNITVNNLVISGGVGVSRALAAANSFRIFNHTGTGTLTLIGLDIRGGRTNGNNERGGAVFSAGTLSLQNVRLESNETLGTNSGGGGAHSDGPMSMSNSIAVNNATRGNASPGGALNSFVFVSVANSSINTNTTFGQGSNGGGIASGNGVVPALELISTQMVGNRVDSSALTPRGGGAISFGSARVINSLIGSNVVNGGDGGGLFISAGGATIDQSTFVFNQAGVGGGALSLFSSASASTITSSTFWRNVASTAAPNVGNGGAIYNLSPLTISNSTFRQNIAGGLGGGVFNNGGSLVLQSTIMAEGQSQSAASPSPTVDIHSNSAISATGANNLVQVVANVTMPAGTLTSDPLLVGITDNGCAVPVGAPGTAGCVTTMALAAGSPAINTGNNAAALANDQRGAGFPRVIGAAADMGAIESGGVAVTTWPINVTVAGAVGGSVSCAPNPVPNGQNANCQPAPNPGYVFVSFSGDCSGATCTLTNVTAARNVTATFALAPTASATPVPTLGGLSAGLLALGLFALGVARRERKSTTNGAQRSNRGNANARADR
jgi:Divergent InlB B-repeat domain